MESMNSGAPERLMSAAMGLDVALHGGRGGGAHVDSLLAQFADAESRLSDSAREALIGRRYLPRTHADVEAFLSRVIQMWMHFRAQQFQKAHSPEEILLRRKRLQRQYP